MRLAQVSSGIGIGSVCGFVLGLLLAQVGIISPLRGLGLSAAGVVFGMAGFVLAIIASLRVAFRESRAGFIAGACLIAVAVGFFAWASRYPPINDIVTDPTAPLSFLQAQTFEENKNRDLSYPGDSFAQAQRTAYPDIQPLRLSLSPEQAFHLVEQAARQMPRWEITVHDPGSHVLEGFAETPLYRFRDDFVIQVKEQEGGSVVQMRSRSRLGRGDLGVNAQRIREFFTKLKQLLAEK